MKTWQPRALRSASCGDPFCADLVHLKRDYCLLAKRLKISQYDFDSLIDHLFPNKCCVFSAVKPLH